MLVRMFVAHYVIDGSIGDYQTVGVVLTSYSTNVQMCYFFS